MKRRIDANTQGAAASNVAWRLLPGARLVRSIVVFVQALLVALIALTTVFPHRAAAQGGGAVLVWLPDVEADATVDRDTVETIFREILAGATDARHIVGIAGLREFLSTGGFPLPDCLQGYGECADGRAAVLQALQATLVVRVVASGGGERLGLDVTDPATGAVQHVDIDEPDVRRAAYRAIGELTGSTAELRVPRTPVPATVFIDDRELGATPIDETLPIGSYALRVVADGYYDYVEQIELRSGDHRVANVELFRRFGTVVVRSGTPGAAVYVDGSVEPVALGDEISLEPGEHVIEVRSADYVTQTMNVRVTAGDDLRYSVALLESRQSYLRRQRQRIIDTPVLVQGGLTIGSYASDLRGATAGESSVDCALADVGGGCENARFSHVGVDAGLIYNWRWLDAEIVGAGIGALNLRGASRDVALDSDSTFATVDRGREIDVRIMHLGARYLIGPYVEPFARTGFTWVGERFGINSDTIDGPLTRGGALWEIRGGARLHVNRLAYVVLEASAAFDLSHGSAPRTAIQIGGGVNLADIVGLRGLLDRTFPPRDDAGRRVPSEL